MQAGHWKHNRLDYDEMNVHPQCVRCNKWLHGNSALYTLHLIRDYGLKAVNNLEERSNQINKYTRQDLMVIIQKYGQN